MLDFLGKWGWIGAAIAGALVSLSFARNVTLLIALTMVSAGIAFAVLTAPLAVYALNPPEPIRDEVLAALSGMFSLTGFILCGALVDAAKAIRATVPAVLAKWIERKGGGDDQR